jgi:hypothetical protein
VLEDFSEQSFALRELAAAAAMLFTAAGFWSFNASLRADAALLARASLEAGG